MKKYNDSMNRFCILVLLIVQFTFHKTAIAGQDAKAFISTFSDKTTYSDLYRFWYDNRALITSDEILKIHEAFIDVQLREGRLREAMEAYGRAPLDDRQKASLLKKISDSVEVVIKTMKTNYSKSERDRSIFEALSEKNGIEYMGINYSYAEVFAELIHKNPKALEELFQVYDVSDEHKRANLQDRLTDFVKYLKGAGQQFALIIGEYEKKSWAHTSHTERSIKSCRHVLGLFGEGI